MFVFCSSNFLMILVLKRALHWHAVRGTVRMEVVVLGCQTLNPGEL